MCNHMSICTACGGEVNEYKDVYLGHHEWIHDSCFQQRLNEAIAELYNG